MTEIIHYKPGHLDFIEPLDCYKGEVIKCAEDNAMCGMAYTLVAEKRPIAVVGCIKSTDYVMTVWAYSGRLIKRYPLFYHKSLKYLIDGNIDALQIKKVQVMVACDNMMAVRQMRGLGFEIEAKISMSGVGGEDEYLLRRMI